MAKSKITVKVNIPKEIKEVMSNAKKGSSREKKDGLLRACEENLATAIKNSGVVQEAKRAVNKAAKDILWKNKEETKKKIAELKEKQTKGKIVQTTHINWNENQKSGPVSATMYSKGVKQRKGTRTRVNVAAKLFYQIVALTPVDEDYTYTRKSRSSPWSPTGFDEKKFFKIKRDKDGKMQVVRVDHIKPDTIRMHRKDENVTRDNWILKIMTAAGTQKIKAGSLGINFDKPSGDGWQEIAEHISSILGRRKLQAVEIVNNDPYIDVLEYGRYSRESGDTRENRHGDLYHHGTIMGYSVQAPRGIMRVAASQLNNLQLEAEENEDNAIHNDALDTIPKVTLKLNSDNAKSYNKNISEDTYMKGVFKDALENEEFFNERDIGDFFLEGEDEVSKEVHLKKADRINQRYFNEQLNSGEVSRALFKEVERISKQIAYHKKATENKKKREEGHLRHLEAQKRREERIQEEEKARQLRIEIKSQKTAEKKALQEKKAAERAAKKAEREASSVIKENYYLFEIPGKDFSIIVEDNGNSFKYALDDDKYVNYSKKAEFKKNVKFLTDELFLKKLEGKISEKDLYLADEKTLIDLDLE